MKKNFLSSPKTLSKSFPDCKFLGLNFVSKSSKLCGCCVENCKIFEEVELKDLIIKNAVIKKNNKNNLENNILNEKYFNFLKKYDSNFFDGIKILLCCEDKEVLEFAKNLFEKLHAEVVCISQELSIETASKTLQKNLFGIGFVFLECGKKIFAINHKGQVLDGDEILYLLAWHMLGQNAKGQVVVGTQKTNLGIENKLRALGVGLERLNVSEEQFKVKFEETNAVLGATQSGLIAIKHSEFAKMQGLLVARVLLSVFLENKNIWEKVKENKYVQVEKEVDLGLFERPLPKDVLKTFVNFYGLKLKNQGRVLIGEERNRLKILVESTEKTSALILAADIKRKIVRYLKRGGL